MNGTSRSRIGMLVMMILAIALIVAACDSGESVDTGETTTTAASGGETTTTAGEGGEDTTTTAAAAPEGGGILIAAQGAEPDRLDPHLTSAYASFQVLENVYDTLVQPGPDLSMEPALAESWEISDDNLTWTFTLRSDVVWHNGRAFTADDVVYSYDRIMDPDFGANNAFRFASIEEVTAVDATTVAIQLSRPTPNLLVNIGAFKGMAIVPREIVEDGTIDTNPVGTGPFRFVSSSPDQGIVLERNPDYWRASEGLPYLDGVTFIQIPDPTVKLTNLRSGEVDWVDTVPPQQLAALEGDSSVVVQRVPGGDYHYFALNQNREPFNDVRVRQAIATAINREEIAEAAQFGAATANQTAIPAGTFWSYDYAPFTASDTAAATALLEEAGVSDLTIEFLVTSDFPETVTQAQVIAAQLDAIGVGVEIRDVDFSTWLDAQGGGDFDAFMLSWIGNIDPDDFYYAQHHSTGGFNFQGYNSPEVDQLLDAARVETDQNARKALYDQAATLIVDEASYTYLYNPENINAWGPQVTGYEVRGDNAIRFVETQLQR
ncbi:MAG: ABC transporter substrate-binding protein [Acidimicrobiia bacterium]|nr:ABC transporter substrate-binding protein [Acidimicrobiia bacterium]